MQPIQHNDDYHRRMTEWRHTLHRHPETAFEEFHTSDLIAEVLSRAGIPHHRGLGGTGIVATLSGKQPSAGTLALRADMDALDLQEHGNCAHRSTIEGKMHGCGHDGHSAMLLGAACWLAEHPQAIIGTVHFIFQPAEENEGGAREMIKDGLFDQFPVDAVFGMHNWPALEAGRAAVSHSKVMSAFDTFEIIITGKGCHAAMPHQGIDPIIIAAELTLALQTIVSRHIDPLEPAVVTVTQVHSGDALNVIPDTAVLRGTCRYFNAEVQQIIIQRMRELAEGIASSHNGDAEVRYQPRYPATINSTDEAALALSVLGELMAADNIDVDLPPSMGAEDFSFMLQQNPGAYIWLGNGSEQHRAPLHSSRYDFNDTILPTGANYWIKLVEAWFAMR
ncbi:hippurate hydrolase [Sinobacterium caligoides]|uniref:Hippurate hydrolase n=1 Tax=Sinobacterium caligoides TaxID=933926 RepID=A0A3N2DE00_9GAMM|nr:M20 aminoacylase family protein [Sinobacterium caligoides]ROR98019.1 hippurate hydrolase [Sinobacterium caligoides]